MTQHQVYTSDQQIFDVVATHLLTQNRRATAPSGGCRYRAVQGDGTVLKCAVGALIPDDLYYPDMEQLTPFQLLNLTALQSLFATPNRQRTLELLRELQSTHDSIFEPRYWRPELGRVARRNDLNTQVLDAGPA